MVEICFKRGELSSRHGQDRFGIEFKSIGPVSVCIVLDLSIIPLEIITCWPPKKTTTLKKGSKVNLHNVLAKLNIDSAHVAVCTRAFLDWGLFVNLRLCKTLKQDAVI